ncbi:MAG TPA: DUF5367 family protein [Terriglobales bacterium]|nr:DUF5367 family protein [Terriglobales bacterium]
MNSYSYIRTVVIVGLLLWIAGTVVIRLEGQHILRTDKPHVILLLYLVSFVVMGLLVRRILHGLGVEKASWPAAATLLMLPTLILDPFSCLFFGAVFPNLDPGAAGAFGGWMLIFCGGAVAGVWVKR